MATLRQKKAIKNVLENGGNITKAMKDAQYSPATVNNPKNLTESDAWKDFIEGTDLDTDLVRVAKQGLKATLNNKPHHDVRFKFWKGINEIKGRFPKAGPLGLPPGKGVAIIAWENSPQ